MEDKKRGKRIVSQKLFKVYEKKSSLIKFILDFFNFVLYNVNITLKKRRNFLKINNDIINN